MTQTKRNRFLFIIPILMLLWMMAHTNIYAEEVPMDEQPAIVDETKEKQTSEEEPVIDSQQSEQDVENSEVITSNPISGPSNETSDISYQAHIQNTGWQEGKQDGQTAGTTGQSKRVEAFRCR